MPDAIDFGFSLLPADDPVSTPEQDLADAEDSAVAPDFGSTAGDPPDPLGMSWELNWETGRFLRRGESAIATTGLGALAQWCQAALHSARFAHPVFGDDFGLEQPEDPIGRVPTDATIRDLGRRIEAALLVHDRVAGIENYDARIVDRGEAIEVLSLDVVTDDQEVLPLGGFTLTTGGL